jgi:hypothetical protein
MRPASCKRAAATVTLSRRPPKHIGYEFVRHDQFVVLHAIVAQQKPAAEPLLHGMKPVADGCLRDLRDERLRVAQQELLNRTTASKFIL